MPHVRDMGFDLIEIAVEDPALIDAAALKKALGETGLGVIVCGAFGPDRNLASPDPAPRQNAAGYIRALIALAAEAGSPLVIGPMYSAVGAAGDRRRTGCRVAARRRRPARSRRSGRRAGRAARLRAAQPL